MSSSALFGSVRHVHLIGICGTAMGSVAAMLKERGFQVSGSDQSVYPPMSTFLEERGITAQSGFSPEHLNPRPDLVVVGNAISRGNVELEAVLDQKLFYLSLPETLKFFFLRDTHNLVVTGTHGKTTTTSLLAWVFEHAGKNPSFMIGGIPANFSEGCRCSGGEHWILEGDEYDTAFFDKRSKFLHYLPELLMINNLEFDHADIFSSLDEIKKTFRRVVQIVPSSGMVVVNADDRNAIEVTRDCRSQILEVGFSPNAAIRITDASTDSEGSRFTLLGQSFFVPLFGMHNIHNAAMVAVAAHSYGISHRMIASAFAAFRGIKRRLEVRAELHGITVIDDFAHHPTAIAGTIGALRSRYPGRRLWVLFEPRSNTTRRNTFQQELPESLKGADHVLLTEIARADQLAPDERLDTGAVVEVLRLGGVGAERVEHTSDLVEAVEPQLRSGDVVAFFSNGGFGGTIESLIKALEHRAS
ncbi:MAG: UDP-N-acetylmuramate:L-alanyl-gamma-D-glutamyl-meso-diaminopimelate ligase [Candidatus Methylacidiphilales bacterium]